MFSSACEDRFSEGYSRLETTISLYFSGALEYTWLCFPSLSMPVLVFRPLSASQPVLPSFSLLPCRVSPWLSPQAQPPTRVLESCLGASSPASIACFSLGSITPAPAPVRTQFHFQTRHSLLFDARLSSSQLGRWASPCDCFKTPQACCF